MRTRFSDNIDVLAADLVAMCGHAETAIADATGPFWPPISAGPSG
ncbi:MULTISPECIES: hypothetical protein [unclassified Rhodococcus (in: high G+C Gram-positive bacteria)]|nr:MULTISPECIES: hypothetical protein [unclassified Rhodococcus (in: high G+C Gram-positive bacteria)]